jgi:transposase
MRYHGVDLHKAYLTVSVRGDEGQEIAFVAREPNIARYVASLSPQDVVAIEASGGALYWAEKIGGQGAVCLVIDAYRFRIIRDSWQKTDRHDAKNLSLALWLQQNSAEVKLPVVWQPTPTVRELRRLTAMYEVVNKQIRQLKNHVQGILLDNGIRDRRVGRRMVQAPRKGMTTLATLDVSAASRMSLRTTLTLLAGLHEQKQGLVRQMYWTGRPIKAQIDLLVGIRGVTPLLALIYLAEVGDVHRFPSARQQMAYQGVVPSVRSSGGKTRTGGINRSSRHLARSLFTQAIPHLAASSPQLGKFYLELALRKGRGRARIAVIRKVFLIMRQMLVNGERYRWFDAALHDKKMLEYERELQKEEALREAA